MDKRLKKILILILIAVLAGLFFAFDLHQYLTLETLKSRQEAFQRYYHTHAVLTLGIYFLLYVVVTALSLPGAAVMTLAGGALFDFLPALVVASFASTIGATLAFLVSRFLLRDWVQSRFGDKLGTINSGVKHEGAFYLFTLRLVPIFPFFVINLVFGLTPMKTWTFYWVSQAGMLAGTAVYINAGTQLGQIETLSGLFSAELILSFALLGVFPLAAKKITDFIKARRVMKDFEKPKKFDYNLVVIGAGSGGLVSAYIAAAVKARVALIERDKMGGDCLNTGCVPSKALIKSAKILSHMKNAEQYGLGRVEPNVDFSAVMERVQRVISKVEPHDSVERYEQLGVECIKGEAGITSPYTVEVAGKTLTTRSIVVATGATPFVPPIEGIDQVGYLTSDNLWSLRELPKRMVVLGGGPIGCEMTQAFARFGAQVTQVEMNGRIMGREDIDVSEFVRKRFEIEGVRVLTKHQARRVKVKGETKILVCRHDEEEIEIEFDAILVAVGRQPNAKGFGLEEIGVKLEKNGTISHDFFLRTNFPNIFCVGDVAGPYQFTHTAGHQAWYAAVNALFGDFKKFKVDYSVVPWCTFTDPEVARVGLNEQEAEKQGKKYEVTRFEFAELDRAIAEEEDHGWVKVVTKEGSDKILGVTIVGPHAGDLIAEYVLAMKQNIGLNDILGTIHVYPTLAEANKMAAGQWKNAHKPEKLLAWVEKFHAWRRG